MKKIYQFLMLAMTLFTVSCSQDEEIEGMSDSSTQGDKITISVGMPEDQQSRAAYDDTSVSLKWQEGDRLVAVGYNAQEEYVGEQVFALQGAGGTASGTFVGNKVVGATSYQFYLMTPQLKLTSGVPAFSYNNVQNGSGSTAHLSGNLFLQSVKLTEAQLTQAFKLKMLNAIVCITVNSVDPNVGAMSKITFETNSEDKDAPKATLSVTGDITFPYKAYLSFNPEAMSLQAGKTFSLIFTGNNEYKVSAQSETGKQYLAGHRYQVTVGEGGLSNWEENQAVKLPIANNSFWVKSATKPVFADQFVDKTNWTISEPNAEGYYEISKNGVAEITEIPKDIFYLKAQGFLEIHCPTTITSIGESAFKECGQLATLSMPNGVTSIGDYAFYNCTSIKNLKLPSKLNRIGEDAFENCYAITSLNIPSKVTFIGCGAFNNCTNLTELNLPANVTIDSYAFGNHALSTVSLPEGTIIKEYYKDCIGAFCSNSENFTDYIISDRCQIKATHYPLKMRNIRINHDATVYIKEDFLSPNDDDRLTTVYFWGSIQSSVAPGFVSRWTAKAGAFDLSLRVEWLNPGDDQEVTANPDDPRVFAHPAYNAEQRTPTPKKNAEGKIIGGMWMGYQWRSITFVDAQGNTVNPSDYPQYAALQTNGAVWGTPAPAPQQ